MSRRFGFGVVRCNWKRLYLCGPCLILSLAMLRRLALQGIASLLQYCFSQCWLCFWRYGPRAAPCRRPPHSSRCASGHEGGGDFDTCISHPLWMAMPVEQRRVQESTSNSERNLVLARFFCIPLAFPGDFACKPRLRAQVGDAPWAKRVSEEGACPNAAPRGVQTVVCSVLRGLLS